MTKKEYKPENVAILVDGVEIKDFPEMNVNFSATFQKPSAAITQHEISRTGE